VKSKYHGNRNKTTVMFQEEVYDLGMKITVVGEYVKGLAPIDVKCEVCEHSWTTTPNSLLHRKIGCNRCAGRINPSIEELQQQLYKLGKTYTVSLPNDTQYVKSTQKVMATCVDCGHNWWAVSLSLRRPSNMCPECRKNNKKIKDEVVPRVFVNYEDLRKVADQKGFILLSESYNRKLEVCCTKCFRQWITSPSNLIDNGCAGCSGKLKGSLENTQNKLNKESRGISVTGHYKNAFSKLDCKCDICLCTWTANSHNLLNGKRGCPSCALTGYDPVKGGYLYYLRVTSAESTYWKIGITNIGIKKRFTTADKELIDVLFCQYFEDGSVPQLCERNILNMYKDYRAENVRVLRAGNTELFLQDVLQMNHLFMERKQWP
jgi:hypothetical protein